MRRQWMIMAMVIGLALSSAGCDAVYRMLQKEGAEEKDIIGELIPHTYNAQVEEVQKRLRIFGYKVGKADGKMGALTRNALEKFQTDYGLEPTRFVGRETWDTLHTFDQSGLVREGEIDMARVQTVLTQLGYKPGPIDGEWGPKTFFAFKAFQKDHDLKVDGKLGINSLTALHEAVLKHSGKGRED